MVREHVLSYGTYYQIELNSQSQFFRKADVWGGTAVFFGMDGDDYFSNDTPSLETHAYGGNGSDTLHGGGKGDYLKGDAGNDVLYGWNGDDTLAGGTGNDLIYGVGGNDTLYGDAGTDRLFGSVGNDYLDGGKDGSADYLEGGYGFDTFVAEWYWSGWWQANRDRPADYSGPSADRIVS